MNNNDDNNNNVEIKHATITSHNEVFVVSDTLRTFPDITITSGEVASSINTNNNIVLKLPDDAGLVWVIENENGLPYWEEEESSIINSISFYDDASFSGNNNQNDIKNNTAIQNREINKKWIILNLNTNIPANSTLSVSGLKVKGVGDSFFSTFNPESIEMSISGPNENENFTNELEPYEIYESNKKDENEFWIGSPTIETSNTNQIFTERIIKNNNTNANWIFSTDIIINNGPISNTIYSESDYNGEERSIRLKIPDSLDITWATELTVSNSKIRNPQIVLEGKVLQLPINESFTSEETVILENIQFIVREGSSPDELMFSVTNENYHDETSFKIGVADPSISTEIDQNFAVGDVKEFLHPITIIENELTSGLSNNSITLRIPLGNQNIIWDSEVILQNNLNITTNGDMHSSPIINRVNDFVITIESDEFGHDDINSDISIISNLSIGGFENEVENINLEYSFLDIDVENYSVSNQYHDIDPTHIAVGQPSISLGDENIVFLTGRTEYIDQIIISEDDNYRTIKDTFNLWLPDSFPGEWNLIQGKMTTTLSNESFNVFNAGKNIQFIFSDQIPQLITIDSLAVDMYEPNNDDDDYTYYVGEQGSPPVYSNLDKLIRLSVSPNHYTYPYFENNDFNNFKKLEVAQPNIEFYEMNNINQNENAIEIAPIYLTDDSRFNILDGGGRILFELEDGFLWTNIAQISCSPFGAINTIPEINDNRLVLTINENIADPIEISGLYIEYPRNEHEAKLLFKIIEPDLDEALIRTKNSFINLMNIEAKSESKQVFFKSIETDEHYRLKTINITLMNINETFNDITNGELLIRIPNDLEITFDSTLTNEYLIFNIEKDSINISSEYNYIEYNNNLKDLIIGYNSNYFNSINFENQTKFIIDSLYFSNEGISESSGELIYIFDGNIGSVVITDLSKKTIAKTDISIIHEEFYFIGDSSEFSVLPNIKLIEDINDIVLGSSELTIVLPEELTWSNIQPNIQFNYLDSVISVNDFVIMDQNNLNIPNVNFGDYDSLQISGLQLNPINNTLTNGEISFEINYDGTEIGFVDEIHKINVFDPQFSTTKYDIVLDNDSLKTGFWVHFNSNLNDEFSNRRNPIFKLPMDLQEYVLVDSNAMRIANPNIDFDFIIENELVVGIELTDSVKDIDSLNIPLNTNIFFESDGLENTYYLDSLWISYRDNTLGTTRPNNFEYESGFIKLQNPVFFEEPFTNSPNFYDTTATVEDYQIIFSTFPGQEINEELLDSAYWVLLQDSAGYTDINLDYLRSQPSTNINNNNRDNLKELLFELNDDKINIINKYLDDNNCNPNLNAGVFIFGDRNILYAEPNISQDTILFNLGFDINNQIFDCDKFYNIAKSISNPFIVLNDLPDTNRLVINNWNDEIILDSIFLNPQPNSIYLSDILKLDSIPDGLYTVQINGKFSEIDRTIFPLKNDFIIDKSFPSINTEFNYNANGKEGKGQTYLFEDKFKMDISDNIISYPNSIFSYNYIDSIYIESENIFNLQNEINLKLNGHNSQLDTASLSITVMPNKYEHHFWQVDSTFNKLIHDIFEDSDYQNINELQLFIDLNISDLSGNELDTTFKFMVINSSELLITPAFNYPNPINNRLNTGTKFRFILSESRTNGELLIFDSSNNIRWSKDLSDNLLNKGVNEVYWSGRDSWDNLLASGVYFAYIQIDGEVIEKINIIIINN